nr:uncharacterized protein LOC109152193 [Ipomoea batatas]
MKIVQCGNNLICPEQSFLRSYGEHERAGSATVTEWNMEKLRSNDGQLMSSHTHELPRSSGIQEVTAHNSKITPNSEDSEGVIITQQKRQRVVDNEGANREGIDWSSPMSIEGRRGYKRRPRFENAWGSNPMCKVAVEAAWQGAVGGDLGERLADCGKRVWSWGCRQMRGDEGELQKLRNKMAELRTARSDRAISEFGRVQREYLLLIKNQSDCWRQSAKELLYSSGDSNSRFFHNSMNTRRRRNAIRGVRDGVGQWITDENGMGQVFVDYFANLFTATAGDGRGALSCVERRVSEIQNEGLLRESAVRGLLAPRLAAGGLALEVEETDSQ